MTRPSRTGCRHGPFAVFPGGRSVRNKFTQRVEPGSAGDVCTSASLNGVVSVATGPLLGPTVREIQDPPGLLLGDASLTSAGSSCADG